jgi:CheY-like chemotaxis protein
MKKRVLVVCDVEANARAIAEALEDETTEVESVPSSRIALGMLARQGYDLVVADSQIGSMGGFALAADLKLEVASGRMEQTPVLVLLDRRADAWLARQLGADGFLVKPINPIRLRHAARALFAGLSYEDPAYRPFTHPLAAHATSGAGMSRP